MNNPLRCGPLLALCLLALTACETTTEGVETTVVEKKIVAAERDRTGRLLIQIDQRVDEVLYLLSQPGDESRKQREESEGLLRAMVAQNLTWLLQAADKDDPRRKATRLIATKALGFTYDPRAVPILAAMLPIRVDDRLVTAALFSLSRIRSPTTPTEPLLELVLSPDLDIRNNALLCLWHVLDERVRSGASALDPIDHERALSLFQTAMLEPEDSNVRGHAAAAMGALRDERSVQPLLNLLHDRNPFVRTHTALALAKVGSPKGIRPLVAAIDDSPEGTARSAVLMAARLLIERQEVSIPPGIGPSTSAWERFVDARLGDRAPR